MFQPFFDGYRNVSTGRASTSPSTTLYTKIRRWRCCCQSCRMLGPTGLKILEIVPGTRIVDPGDSAWYQNSHSCALFSAIDRHWTFVRLWSKSTESMKVHHLSENKCFKLNKCAKHSILTVSAYYQKDVAIPMQINPSYIEKTRISFFKNLKLQRILGVNTSCNHSSYSQWLPVFPSPSSPPWRTDFFFQYKQRYYTLLRLALSLVSSI